MKIAIISLGCPKNQVDADVFCHALIKDGHTTVADPAEADIIIINTCGFIESAKTEAIENILMACQYKQENPDLKVIVTGCLAERYKQQIIQEIPEVDAVVGIGSNAALPAIVRRVCADGAGQTESYGPKSDMQLGGARVISTPRHYAYLKIAEGCNNGCYYCAIPLIRGALRSREINDCVAEARWLAGEGVRELILVAQDPTAYGEDWGRPGAICELLDRLQEIDGIRWIRILYAYPERISDAFIAAMVRNTKVVPYLDLPIQHCDDAVLKAMNRRGGRKEIMDLISPCGPVYQAGTLSGNPVAMAAGFTQLKYLYEHQEIYKELAVKGEKLYGGLKKIVEEKGLPYQVNYDSSLASIFFTDQEVKDYVSAKTSNLELFAKYFKGMLKRGIHLAPSQFEAMFLSTAHTDEVIDETLEAMRGALGDL